MSASDSRVTIHITFKRSEYDRTATLLRLKEDGREESCATLREESCNSSVINSVTHLLLPFQFSQLTYPGHTWLLRGNSSGRVLMRMVAKPEPAVQEHIHDECLDTRLGTDDDTSSASDDDLFDEPQMLHEVRLEEAGPCVTVGPLLQAAFAVSEEARHDAAFAEAVATGLLTESEMDSLTDDLARVTPGCLRDGLMRAQLASLWARQQAAEARPHLTVLPIDVLTAVLAHAHAASPRRRGARVLACCASACRVLHHCAEEAAKSIAAESGLELSIARCPSRILALQQHAVLALHALLTALPKPFRPTPPTVAYLARVLAPHKPALCTVPLLVLPSYVTGYSTRCQAEYINLAAMLRAGLGWSEAASGVEDIQGMIEAAWAEGIDPDGRAANARGLRPRGPASDKDQALTAIGAADLLAALLHLRVDAVLLEVHMGVGGAQALYDAVVHCLERQELGGTSLPMRVGGGSTRPRPRQCLLTRVGCSARARTGSYSGAATRSWCWARRPCPASSRFSWPTRGTKAR